jgi:hypothetical protein
VELLIEDEDAEYMRATFGTVIDRDVGWYRMVVQIDLVARPFVHFGAFWIPHDYP